MFEKYFIENYFSEPILEEDLSGKGLRTGSITHGKEMSFQDFEDLFKIFRFIIKFSELP